MTSPINATLDFGNRRRIINLAPGAAPGEPVVYEQMNAAIEGIAWKDNCRAASTVNVTIASPGATIDSVTLAANDRVLLKNQTAQSENGIYIWNGAATPMARALDSATFSALENAIVPIDEGSNAGTTWRQTQVNGVIGTNNVVWTSFFPASPPASESAPGIIEIVTQAEVDAGTDDTRAVTSAKLANYAGRAKRFAQSIGDGSATSIVVTHNLNTLDCQAYVYETGGSKREIFCEKQHTSVNSVTIITDTPFAAGAARVVVQA